MIDSICSNCLLNKESTGCEKSFCNITHFKIHLYELAEQREHNINTIIEKLKIDKSSILRFTTSNFGMSPKKLLDVLRLIIFIDKYDDKKDIEQILIQSGFNNSRNFRNILHKNYNMTAKIFINEVKMVKNTHEDEIKLKYKLLNINE